MISFFYNHRYVTWEYYLLDQAIYVLANRLNTQAVHIVVNELEMKKPQHERKVVFGADNQNIKIQKRGHPYKQHDDSQEPHQFKQQELEQQQNNVVNVLNKIDENVIVSIDKENERLS